MALGWLVVLPFLAAALVALAARFVRPLATWIAFAAALFVKVSVIGRNVEGRVTCDGGNKHFSAKETLPAFRILPAEGAIYRPDSDEHGIIELPNGAPQPALGASFEMIVPHCDPTVNLYDHLHVVEGDKLIDIWPIEARGAF